MLVSVMNYSDALMTFIPIIYLIGLSQMQILPWKRINYSSKRAALNLIHYVHW